MSLLPVRQEPTCEFWGGPWDGRTFSYPHLFTHMFVPDMADITTMILPNMALTNSRGDYGGTTYQVHVYERGWVREKPGGIAYAKYFYRGIR